MGLQTVRDAAVVMSGTGYPFTEAEKESVLQFAFKSGSKEHTNRLIDELEKAQDKEASREILIRYRSECGRQPAWIEEIENLLVALEVYRMEQERAVRSLSDALKRYGISMPAEKIRQMEAEEIREEIQTVTNKKTEAR